MFDGCWGDVGSLLTQLVALDRKAAAALIKWRPGAAVGETDTRPRRHQSWKKLQKLVLRKKFAGAAVRQRTAKLFGGFSAELGLPLVTCHSCPSE